MEILSTDDIKQVSGGLTMGEGALGLIGIAFVAPLTVAGAAAFGIGLGLLAMHTYYSSV